MVRHALDVLIREHALPQQLLLVELVHIVVRLDFLRMQHTVWALLGRLEHASQIPMGN